MIYKYYLSLGSNIEPRLKHLKEACFQLNAIGMIIKVSSLYETEPWGNKNQGDFYNAMIEFDSTFTPKELLAEIKLIEQNIGRKSDTRWSAREIDIDIIFCRDCCVDEPSLKIPHTEFSSRRFILEPMEEINKNFLVPHTNKTITDYLAVCQDQSYTNKLVINWWENGN